MKMEAASEDAASILQGYRTGRREKGPREIYEERPATCEQTDRMPA